MSRDKSPERKASKLSKKDKFCIWSERRKKNITEEARLHKGKLSVKPKHKIFPIMHGFNFGDPEAGEVLQLRCTTQPELKFGSIDLGPYNLVTDVAWKHKKPKTEEEEEEARKADFTDRFASVAEFQGTLLSGTGRLTCEDTPWKFEFEIVRRDEDAGIRLSRITVKPKVCDPDREARRRRAIERELRDLPRWPPSSEEEE